MKMKMKMKMKSEERKREIPMTTTTEYLTVQEAADYLDVSRETIRQWINTQRVDAEPDPIDRRRKRIPAWQLDAIQRGDR